MKECGKGEVIVRGRRGVRSSVKVRRDMMYVVRARLVIKADATRSPALIGQARSPSIVNIGKDSLAGGAMTKTGEHTGHPRSLSDV